MMSSYERGLPHLRREVVTRKEFPPSGVIFRAIPVRIRRKKIIRLDAQAIGETLESWRILGEQLRRFRTENNILLKNFAALVGINKSTLSLVEKGKRRVATEIIDRFVQAIELIDPSDRSSTRELEERFFLLLNPKDPRSEEVRTNFEKRHEDRKWLRTLVSSGASSGTGIKYLRLSELLKQREIIDEVESSRKTVVRKESDHSVFSYSLNQIIETSPLDSEGKAVQFIRAKEAGVEIMSVIDLQTCSYGVLENYLRVVKGWSVPELAHKIDQKYDRVSRRESKRRGTQSRFVNQVRFIALLGLEGSPLGKVISYKSKNPDKEVPREMLQGIAEGKYLFAEYINRLGKVTVSATEELLQDHLKTIPNFGGRLNYLITKHHHLTLSKFAELTGKHKNYISERTRGKRIPEDYNIVLFLSVLGYDIHHPITWDFLKQAAKERREKEPSKYKTKPKKIRNNFDTA